MPLTPLHLAAGLPLRKHISMKAFILVNLCIDLEVALILFFGMDTIGYSLHRGMHTLGGATLAVAITMFMTVLSKERLTHWLYGALLGAYSHILLDALVHHDVQPFAPLLYGNPLYLDIHEEVSITCVIVLTWYLAMWVQSLRVSEVGLVLCKRFRSWFLSCTSGK